MGFGEAKRVQRFGGTYGHDDGLGQGPVHLPHLHVRDNGIARRRGSTNLVVRPQDPGDGAPWPPPEAGLQQLRQGLWVGGTVVEAFILNVI